jgi:recombination associated protein RdgC
MFKNLTLYRAVGSTSIFSALDAMPFTPGTGTQEMSVGWVPPRGIAHGPLVEAVNSQWVMRFMVETRQVPGAAIQAKVDEACAAIEASSGRKPGKKEKRDLKEEAKAALLPTVFPRLQATWVWIDPTTRLLAIDSTSPGRCDDILTALVKLVDGFIAEPLQTSTSPAVAMARWLSEQEAPDGFAIGNECELKAADESHAVVRYAHHPLLTDEVRDHITQGKQPTRLALHWDDRVQFVLTDKLQLKKLVFEKHVVEQAKALAQRADDFDGSVMMATTELAALVRDLVGALDGEVA